MNAKIKGETVDGPEYLEHLNLPWTPPPPYSPSSAMNPNNTEQQITGRQEETVVTIQAEPDFLDSIMSRHDEFIFKQTDKLGTLSTIDKY